MKKQLSFNIWPQTEAILKRFSLYCHQKILPCNRPSKNDKRYIMRIFLWALETALIWYKKKTENRLSFDTPNNGINFLNTSDFCKNVLNIIYSLCRRDETSFSRKHKGMSLLALSLLVLFRFSRKSYVAKKGQRILI